MGIVKKEEKQSQRENRKTENKKTDLRVIRTKKNIRAAFVELAKKKPVRKITVTELAEKAMINKGTFYLHYKDIYELYLDVIQERLEERLDLIEDYSRFFDDPEGFTQEFFSYFSKGKMEEEFPILSETLGLRLPVMITQRLKQRLYDTGRVEESPENDMKLECALICFFMTGGRYQKKHPKAVGDTVSTVIQALFQNTGKKSGEV